MGASAATISGAIHDAKDTSAMIGVVINIVGTQRSAQTDMDGHYEFQNMPDGTYTLEFNYVSYAKQSITVTVASGADVVQDVTLKATGNQLTGTTVRTGRRTNTESSVIMEIKKSSVAVSGISAAQISKTQDRNAADVVKRIPGVTIQDDRFITVRGLADRYNTVWLNDAGAPSSEVDKKSFSFDLIPSGLIDRILVFKTPAANLPGDFAGGMVKIYTTSIPEKNQYNFAVQGSYRDGSTGTDFNYEPRRPGDALGYDNGSRNIPAGVPSGFFDRNTPGAADITKAFGNNWIINSKKESPDLRLSGSASNVFKLKAVKIGNTIGGSYSNTRTNYNVQRYSYTDTSQDYHYNDHESINKVNLALLENVAAVIGNTKLEFKNLYNQIGTSGVTERTSVQDPGTSPTTNLRAYQLAYENRKTYTSQLSGTHHNEDNSRKYNWTLGYSNLMRNQPDLRRITYAEDAAGNNRYYAQVTQGVDINNGGGKYYASLNEKTYSFNHEFSQQIPFSSDYKIELSLGNYLEYKTRDFEARELGYTLRRTDTNLIKLPISQIFAPSNVGDQSNFMVADNTAPYDHYQATNTLIASFLSLNVPIGNRVKALIGARYESNKQTLESVLPTLDTIKPELKTNYLLPSINVTYNFTPKMLARVAYGKTLNRPEFREQAPLFFYDFSLRAGTYGAMYQSDTLSIAEVDNLDARWEYYPSAGELVHAGIFYKRFKNPIQQVIVVGVSDKSFTFRNGQDAYVAGFELDVRKNLSFLDDKFGTKFLKNIVLVGNLSLSKSELTIDTSRVRLAVPKGPLQNQSDYVVNAGIFYQNDSLALQGSLLYNYYSPRLYAVGTIGGGYGSIGELGFHSLDFTLSKSFYKHYSFTVGVQNLLDQTLTFVEDVNQDNKFDKTKDTPFTNYKPGRYFTVGVKLRF